MPLEIPLNIMRLEDSTSIGRRDIDGSIDSWAYGAKQGISALGLATLSELSGKEVKNDGMIQRIHYYPEQVTRRWNITNSYLRLLKREELIFRSIYRGEYFFVVADRSWRRWGNYGGFKTGSIAQLIITGTFKVKSVWYAEPTRKTLLAAPEETDKIRDADQII